MAEKPAYEIIEDEPARPKRKRYRRPLFGHIPWRWVISAFAAGVLLVAGVGLLLIQPLPIPDLTGYPATSTPVAGASLPIPQPSPTYIAVGERILDLAESGEWLAVAGSSSLRLYRNRALTHLLYSYDDVLLDRHAALAFSPDGRQLSALSIRNSSGVKPFASLKIYEIESGKQMRETIAHQDGLANSYSGVALAYSPDGKLLASGAGDGWTTIWDTTTGVLLGRLNTLATGTMAMAFSADSARLTLINRMGSGYSANHESANIQVWDVSDPIFPKQLGDKGAWIYPFHADSAAITPDGRYVAHVTKQQDIAIYNLDAGTAYFTLAFDNEITIEDIALSPKGDMLAFVQQSAQVSTEPEASVVVRVLRLFQASGFASNYEELGEPVEVGVRGAVGRGMYMLRFRPDGSALTYLTRDYNILVDWNLLDGATRTMRF